MRLCITLGRMSEIGTWWEYVVKYSRGQSQREIAATLDVDPSAVGRWKDGVRPRAEQVVEFARRYGRSPVESLIHAGYIEASEVGQAIEIAGSMKDVSDKALVHELTDRLAELRRLQRGGDNTQSWPPVAWRQQDTRMGRVQNRD